MTEMGVKYLTLQETERSNLAREGETKRANMAQEEETHRSNVEREIENKRSNQTREIEENRSNLAREAENFRANSAKEKETHRSNTEREKIDRAEQRRKKEEASWKYGGYVGKSAAAQAAARSHSKQEAKNDPWERTKASLGVMSDVILGLLPSASYRIK